MGEIQVWVLTGSTGLMVSVLLILFRNWTDKQSKLVDAIQELKLLIATQSLEMKTLLNTNIDIRQDIKELKTRISKVEEKQISCGKCMAP